MRASVGVSHMITGGVASVIYGHPWVTRGVELVVEPCPAEIPVFQSAFDEAAFYIPPAEALEEVAARAEGSHFNVIHTEAALRADAYLAGDDP